MKKILTSVLAIAMICTMLFVLVSCGGPSGKYGDKLGVSTITFDGGEVSLKLGTYDITSATYEMGDDGKILITYEDDGEEKELDIGLVYDEDADTIKWGLVTLEKKDK